MYLLALYFVEHLTTHCAGTTRRPQGDPADPGPGLGPPGADSALPHLYEYRLRAGQHTSSSASFCFSYIPDPVFFQRVSHTADKELQDIEKKYPGFIHMKLMKGIMLSYRWSSCTISSCFLPSTPCHGIHDILLLVITGYSSCSSARRKVEYCEATDRRKARYQGLSTASCTPVSAPPSHRGEPSS